MVKTAIFPLFLWLIFAFLAVGPRGATAQITTESLTLDAIAPDAPEWMTKLAATDDYREPTSSAKITAQPYPQARIDAPVSHAAAMTSPRPTGYQPAGSLSGKVIFAMAGHGWTYDPDEMYYYTQRGLSHGMVEDMGNADQMHIFAHTVFNSGATVVPLRPIDHQPNERVIDNTMPQAHFYGDWRAGSSDRFFGELENSAPYAVAKAGLIETALARYRPWLPETGYYPVYVWARDGADRANQLYRVRHSGGTTEVRVNWRQVGKAWVWLGTYHFEKGDTGCVEISNQVIDPYEAYGSNIIVADAVRFGNGKGDVPRPAGISGFDREDEGDSYWIERSLGFGADRRLFDIGRDGNSTVSSPPKAAAHINRESYGSYLDRLLISFHSNAATGKARGTVGLYNASPKQRPSYQEGLAEIIGAEMNAQMSHEKAPAGEAWTDRERNTYSGINFGELRRDYVQNEMAATIIENAFHDNAEDVTFLLDPRSRINMAQATLRGILQWSAGIQNSATTNAVPPARPAGVAATVQEGHIQVKWIPGEVGHFEGGPAVSMRVCRSTNGFGFDGGQEFSATANTATVDPLTTSGATFLRVTASNAAGESFPSQTIAVYPGHTAGKAGKKQAATTLLISANTVLDRSANIPYALGIQPSGGPYKETAQTERVRALYTLMEPSGAAEAQAMAALGVAFDGADTAGWEADLLGKSTPDQILITTEQQQPNAPLFSADSQDKLRDFVTRGGKLYISGSGFATNLFTQSPRKDISFVNDILGITGAHRLPSGQTAKSEDNRFLPTASAITIEKQNRPWATEKTVSPAAFLPKKGRSLGLLRYNTPGETGFGALLTRPTASQGEVIVLGFPLSLINDPQTRTTLMAAILKQL